MYIYVDGGKNRDTGDYAFASIVDSNGNDLIKPYSFLFQDFDLQDVTLPVGKRTIIRCLFPGVEQQNNGAELIAALCGTRIALYTGNIDIIYSDSDLIVKYWSKNISKVKRYSLGFYKYYLINQLISNCKEWNGKIVKIPGKDNLADLGYHR